MEESPRRKSAKPMAHWDRLCFQRCSRPSAWGHRVCLRISSARRWWAVRQWQSSPSTSRSRAHRAKAAVSVSEAVRFLRGQFRLQEKVARRVKFRTEATEYLEHHHRGSLNLDGVE